ncbi:MAG: cytochrome c biogenesis protein CcsA [Aureliella sp.]
MLTGVSVSCFLFSYLVVLGMEAGRLFLKLPAKGFLLIAMMAAGFLAHSIFLFNEFGSSQSLLGNWFQWTVLGAWALSGACLYLTFRNSESSTGLFLIPIILGLIGVAQLLRDSQPFQPQTTVTVWRMIHGVSLLVGTIFICFGCAFAIMYLLKSWRLKHRRMGKGPLKLPTLEFLQSINRMSLLTSTIGLAIGLISGIVLNINSQGPAIWLNSGIILTFVLFVVSLIASSLELSSPSSLGGRRGAYLSLANFAFLALVLLLTMLSSHGQSDAEDAPSTQSQNSQLTIATEVRS